MPIAIGITDSLGLDQDATRCVVFRAVRAHLAHMGADLSQHPIRQFVDRLDRVRFLGRKGLPPPSTRTTGVETWISEMPS